MKDLFSIDMEICYVPAAKISQKREMMSAWNKLNKYLKICCLICAAADLFASFGGALYMIPAAAIMVICAFLVKQNNRSVYYVTVLSGFIIPAVLFATQGRGLPFYSVCAAAAFFALPLFFGFKSLYNYDTVFVPLSKSKGFPNFIFSTTDMYGKKMFLRDGEKTVAELREKESFNGLNTEDDVERERFERSQNLVAAKESKSVTLDITAENTKLPKKKATAYKYGKMLGDFELVFLHNDIPSLDYSEKKILINKWNCVVDGLSNGFATLLFLRICMIIMLLITMGAGAILLYVPIIFNVFGINNIKMGKLRGIFYIIASSLAFAFPAVVCVVSALTDAIGKLAFGFGLVMFAMCVPGLLRAIHLLLNYDIYKQLAKEKGFPSFVQTVTERFADELYVAAKPMPEYDLSREQSAPAVVDIGIDEPKKQKKAWNAFDYMDENGEVENEENN